MASGSAPNSHPGVPAIHRLLRHCSELRRPLTAVPRKQVAHSVGPWGVCLAGGAQRRHLYQDKHTSHGHLPYGVDFSWILVAIGCSFYDFSNIALRKTSFSVTGKVYDSRLASSPFCKNLRVALFCLFDIYINLHVSFELERGGVAKMNFVVAVKARIIGKTAFPVYSVRLFAPPYQSLRVGEAL